MDFSFKFLEMFEDRFGKKATGVLLGAIGMAVLAFCARELMSFALMFCHIIFKLSKYGIVEEVLNVLTARFAVTTVVLCAVYMSFSLIVWSFVVRPIFITPRERRFRKELEEKIEKIGEYLNIEKEMRLELRSLLSDSKSLNEQTKALIQDQSSNRSV